MPSAFGRKQYIKGQVFGPMESGKRERNRTSFTVSRDRITAIPVGHHLQAFHFPSSSPQQIIDLGPLGVERRGIGEGALDLHRKGVFFASIACRSSFGRDGRFKGTDRVR
jgi:hypothetical protein